MITKDRSPKDGSEKALAWKPRVIFKRLEARGKRRPGMIAKGQSPKDGSERALAWKPRAIVERLEARGGLA